MHPDGVLHARVPLPGAVSTTKSRRQGGQIFSFRLADAAWGGALARR